MNPSLSDFLIQFPLWLLLALLGVIAVMVAYVTLIQGRTLKIGAMEIGGRASTNSSAADATPAQASPSPSTPAKPSPLQPAEPRPASVLLPIERGDLGHGIVLGGVLHDRELRVFGSSWQPWSMGGKVRSGFFYEADDEGLTCPIAAFKVHYYYQNGTGRFHIVSMASPEHTMWIETPVEGRRRQKCNWKPQGEARPDWSETFTIRAPAGVPYP